MKKEKNYDEKVRIVRFKNAMTIKDALLWTKKICVDSAYDGHVEIANCNYLESWQKDYDAIFNRIAPDGKKIYKNSTREWSWKRFANQKVNYLIMVTCKSGYFYQYLADSYAFNRLTKQINDAKEIGIKYLVEMMEVNIRE